jgi:MFS family permease
MVAQAFFYNSLLFTYGLVLLKFYKVPSQSVGLYLLPLALGNFLGPMVFGKLFDSVGRKVMIASTYSGAGILLFISAWMFQRGMFTARTQAIAWAVVLFVASSAASSAYLTVSEVFPLEIRALAIAVFYGCGTLIGGVGAPALFAKLVESGSRSQLFWGYTASALLMIGAGITEAFQGVAAEGQSLEKVSAPLSSQSG